MRAVVTGGSGYIGQHLIHSLLEKKYEVISIDKDDNSTFANEPIYSHDIRYAISKRISNQIGEVDAVYHLAGLAYVEESFNSPQDYVESNIVGTRNVLDLASAINAKTVIFASSCSIFKSSSKRISETDSFEPLSPYALTKLAAETMISDWSSKTQNRHGIARFFNVAGGADKITYDNHDPETHLIPNVIRSIEHSFPIKVNGTDFPTKDGTAVRDFIHVSDLCRGLLLLNEYCSTKGNLEINFGSGIGTSILQVIQTAEKVLEKKATLAFHPRRVGDGASLVADVTLAKTLLGFTADQSSVENLIRSQIKAALSFEKRH